jgi:hypothetical protein
MTTPHRKRDIIACLAAFVMRRNVLVLAIVLGWFTLAARAYADKRVALLTMAALLCETAKACRPGRRQPQRAMC